MGLVSEKDTSLQYLKWEDVPFNILTGEARKIVTFIGGNKDNDNTIFYIGPRQ